MKIDFNINKLEIGDIIVFFNGEEEKVDSIEKCPCGKCETYYINGRYNMEYNIVQYIIKTIQIDMEV